MTEVCIVGDIKAKFAIFYLIVLQTHKYNIQYLHGYLVHEK